MAYYTGYMFSLFGAILSESAEVTFSNENADSDVITQDGGFVGVTPHGGKTIASVSLFDPVLNSILAKLQEYEQTSVECDAAILQKGGKTMKLKGYIRNVKGSSAVGSNASISFDFHAPSSAFV